MSDQTRDGGAAGVARRLGLVAAGGLALVAALWAVLAYGAPPRLIANLPVPVPHPGRSFDLKTLGGARLVLAVDTSAPTTVAMDGLTEQIRATLRAHGIGFDDLTETDEGVSLRLVDPTRAPAAQVLVGALAPPAGAAVVRRVAVVRGPGGHVDLLVQDRPDRTDATARAVVVVRRRMVALGAIDPKVEPIGPDRIRVEAPGVNDLQKAVWAVTRFGRLSFQLVDDTVGPDDARAGRLPPDDELLAAASPGLPATVVRRGALLTGAHLTNAQLAFDVKGGAAVAFRLDAVGARLFADATTDNAGKRFAIVLDGRVISTPVIQDPITSGQGEITGEFTPKQADDLAKLLTAGPLPAPLRVVEQDAVRPPG